MPTLDRMSTSAPPTGDLKLRRYRVTDLARIVYAVVLLGMLGLVRARAGDGEVKLCSEVHSRCFARDGCKYALENYVLGCLDMSGGEAFQCTQRCKMALIMLLSSDEHDGPNAFRDCDCMDDEFCIKQKERIAVCADDVQTWLDDISNPDTRISCSLAGLVCSADTPCLAAIDYYHDHCKKLIEPHNPRCTSRCNNSLNILYRQAKAQKLRTCFCDGTEMYNCTALKDNTQNLCYGVEPHAHETSTRVRHPDNHDHSRGCHNPGHNPDSNPHKDIANAPVQPRSSSSHNSAYTIHSRASATLCLSDKQSVHLVLVILSLTLAYLQR